MCPRSHTLLSLGMMLAVAASSSALAAPGDLDPTFGGTGKVITPIGASGDIAASMALRADGKIVLAGQSFNGTNDDFAVARYNSNGSLDTTFAGTGKVTTPIGSLDDRSYSVAVQADGKTVAVGNATIGCTGCQTDFAVVRYNSNGSLDTTFSGDGKVLTPIGTSFDEAFSVALQVDGKIVVAGSSSVTGGSNFAVVRYNSNGSLDTTFGGTGKVTTPVGTAQAAAAAAVAVQADGKIVVAGYAYNGSGDTDFAVVRYNSNGALDTTFSGDGKVVTTIYAADEYSYATSVALQTDGKIVVAGYSVAYGTGDYRSGVVRYNSNGSLDTTFGGTGRVATGVSALSVARSVALQTDGKILVAGGSLFGDSVFAVVRHNANGSLDTTFGGTGEVSTFETGSFGRSVVSQADGNIVVAGSSYNGSNDDFAVVRYDGAPTCGDGDIEVGEQCDDAAILSGNGCSSTCQIETGWSCSGEPSMCAPICGDSLVTGPEHCDDGDVMSGDGCSATCTVELGYGCMGSPSSCAEICGDGLVVGDEGCDDENLTSNDGCNGICVVEAGWSCSGEPSACAPVCGDGLIRGTEGCDDANLDDGDGCADACAVETGWNCAGEPSTCSGNCGDSIVVGSEDCDEGAANGTSPSCCSATCSHEPASTPCADGDLCNGDETCDGAGTCQPGAALECDDANACTQDSCDPILGCENTAEPATTCADTWEKGLVLVKETIPGKEQLIVQMRKGPALTQADFGDPLDLDGTAFTACVYDDAGALVGSMKVDRAGDSCGPKDCWKALGALPPSGKGFLYKDAQASSDGITQIKLNGGAAGKSSAQMRSANNGAKGQLALPLGVAGRLASSSSATVQLFGSGAPECLSLTVEDVKQQTSTLFKATK